MSDREPHFWQVEKTLSGCATCEPGLIFEAESVRFEGGVAVFTNGDLFSAELVVALAPGTWAGVTDLGPVADFNHDDEEIEL